MLYGEAAGRYGHQGLGDVGRKGKSTMEIGLHIKTECVLFSLSFLIFKKKKLYVLFTQTFSCGSCSVWLAMCFIGDIITLIKLISDTAGWKARRSYRRQHERLYIQALK